MVQSSILHNASGKLRNARVVVPVALQQYARIVGNVVDRRCESRTICSGVFSAPISTQGSSIHTDYIPSVHALQSLPSSSFPSLQHDIKSLPFENMSTRPTHQHVKYFSTAAAEFEEPSTATAESKPTRLRKRKAPIAITPRAAERVIEILSSPNAEGAHGIRLGVKRRGCNGLSYTLNYAFERMKGEEEVTDHGVTIFVEPMAIFSIVGTVMDWEENDLSSEFTFVNPNSKGECGCGESFNV